MKRGYKQGDWVRVPLGGEYDALAIITHACRSRLFGYFFAYPAAQQPAHDELRAFSPAQAIAMMLFGGAPIEHGRWPVIATSLAFAQDLWPFPAFASRGAFGEAWTQVRYDPSTLQIVQRSALDAQAAQSLPDARFTTAPEVEDVLRRRVAGDAAPRAQSVYELRSPLDESHLRTLQDGATIQFSTHLDERDLQALGTFLDDHPGVRVRVHGFRRGFDAKELGELRALNDLTLDVHRLQHAKALRELQSLRALRIGAMQIDLTFLPELPALTSLQLHGTRAATLEPVERCASLETVFLENTPPIDFGAMSSAPVLRVLTLAHGAYDFESLAALSKLRRLELRALDVAQLPALDALTNLDVLVLRELHAVTDLSPIMRARSLRDLVIAGMPQLNVEDFQPLAACAGLQNVHIDIGSRRKEREIYRLMRFGNR